MHEPPHDPERVPEHPLDGAAEWTAAEISGRNHLSPADPLASPSLQDALRRLQLLDQAQNLRRRGEADAQLAVQAARSGDTARMMAYLRRSFRMVLAANRTIDQAGDGFTGPDGILQFPHETRQVADLHYYYRAGPLQAVARCRLRIWERHGEPAVVVATELADNAGMSVTNAAAELATDVWDLLGFPERGLTWIEHYPERGRERHQQENFAQVSFTWAGQALTAPQWRFMTRSAVEALIGGPLDDEKEEKA